MVFLYFRDVFLFHFFGNFFWLGDARSNAFFVRFLLFWLVEWRGFVDLVGEGVGLTSSLCSALLGWLGLEASSLLRAVVLCGDPMEQVSGFGVVSRVFWGGLWCF